MNQIQSDTGTSYHETVRKILSKFNVELEKNIEIVSVSYDNYAPESLDIPRKEQADNMEFVTLTVYTSEETVLGWGMREKTKTYGRPVTVELDVFDLVQ